MPGHSFLISALCLFPLHCLFLLCRQQKKKRRNNVVLITTLQNANIPESGEEVDNERVMKNTEKICKELVWYVDALGTHAAQKGPCPT